jgi:hypothetical protein
VSVGWPLRAPDLQHAGMRSWWFNAPQWVLSLVMGGLFALFGGLYTWGQDGNPVLALIAGLAGGLVFGLIMGRLLYRQFAALRHAMGPGSREALQTTARGAWRGPLPEDPAAREAALRLARYQLGELRRRRTVTYAVFAVALALETWLALTSSPQ